MSPNFAARDNCYLFLTMHSSDELNGKDHRDFPIPPEYRVSRDASTGRWNYTQLAGAILKGLLDYDNALPKARMFEQCLFLA
jgi:hypothetical protein